MKTQEDLTVNGRNIPVEPDTKSLLVIQEERTNEEGQQYIMAAIAQTDKKETLRTVIKNSSTGKNPEEGSLAARLESYIECVKERGIEEDPKLKVSVSKCHEGNILSTEEMSFTIKEFEENKVHLPKQQNDLEK